MSRIRNRIILTAGATAGLFLAMSASSATASADTATPTGSGLPGLVEQIITSPTSIPQQLLQTASSALTGAPLAPATPAAPPPLATATINLPQAPPALNPGTGTAAGLPAVPGLPLPGNLNSVLPFPMPNLGATSTAVTTPTATLPGAFIPSAPVVSPAPAAVQLIPGLP